MKRNRTPFTRIATLWRTPDTSYGLGLARWGWIRARCVMTDPTGRQDVIRYWHYGFVFFCIANTPPQERPQ